METNAEADAIALDHIEIERGHKTIIRDVTLSIPRGTVFGLIGPSGSGKTTLLRGLLGLSPITSGDAMILGLRAGSAQLRACIGYMPQDAAIYPDLSCRENLEFFASIYRAPHSRIDDLIRMLDLESAADRPVATYSGGQRQRAALAAAMIPEPDLLMLDEPTVGLDPRLRVRLWDTFAELAANRVTLLISTHVMDEAEKCERIAFLSDGQLVATGSPEELREQADAESLEAAVLALTAPEKARRAEASHVH